MKTLTTKLHFAYQFLYITMRLCNKIKKPSIYPSLLFRERKENLLQTSYNIESLGVYGSSAIQNLSQSLSNTLKQNKSLSFDDWRKFMMEQNRMMDEAIKKQGQMMNEAIKQYSNKSVTFEDWTKVMTEQSRLFSEALKSQGTLMDDAIKQYAEMNSKMFDYAIQHYSETNSKLIQDAIRNQGQIMDDIIKQQGRIFDDAIEQFSQKNAKMLDDATKRQADGTNSNDVKKKKD